MRLFTVFAAMVAATAGVALAAGVQTPPDLQKQIARGKAVYAEQKCQACHAIAGAGNRRSPLDGVGSKLSAADIRTWIVAPREMNPRVAKRAYTLPPADLDALVAYLKSLTRK